MQQTSFWNKTCLYFGTFNPIHTGHLLIAQAALQSFPELRSVTFIPAGTPPHRHQESDLLDARRRLLMVQLAIADNPRFQVSALEAEKPGPSYTVETLQTLVSQGVMQAPVPMIIGSDALAQLATWHEPQALIKLARFLQAPRPDCAFVQSITLNGQSIALDTQSIEMPMLALSSTWVRRMIQENKTDALRYALPDPVRRFIRENGLYRD